MRESIKKIVWNGGAVKFDYCAKRNDRIREVKIYGPIRPAGPVYIVDSPTRFTEFRSIDKAVSVYMDLVFTRRNIALALQGWRMRGLSLRDIEGMPLSSFRAIIREYNAKYFAIDYPFADKKRAPKEHA